ncbi:hypothetical protein HOP50_07g48310 [Chloropicon primus]|uniref:Saposin B-type domain-containing protein n=2 Tax=Chloropicon primus TaxID=1764295 RepID=A0A5B8MP35_9CHLO|nr:hypothetical protein A3770_07p48110 [Chloropicon primus]UPR01509.1 hypothetical protein HOP50_07g48310 [Chloropicon primus]|eukprot:QDZ22293.1 hypothetical protein A3770_07p48110 [Chloropicon primus]
MARVTRRCGSGIVALKVLAVLALSCALSVCHAYDCLKCEACQLYQEQLFDIHCRTGVVTELDESEGNVCENEHFWHLSEHAHSDELKEACEKVHEEGTRGAWNIFNGTEVDCDSHASHQLLVEAKRNACFYALGVCPDLALPQKLDRARTDCELCDAVISKIAGFLSRYELDHISDYRIEGLLIRKLEDEYFCSADFDKDFFDDPDLGSTEDIQQYCSAYVKKHSEKIIASFLKHKSKVMEVLTELCPAPCDLNEAKEEL